MQGHSTFDIAMLVFAALAAMAGVVAILPLFGFDLRIIGRPAVPLDQTTPRTTKRAWLALVLVLVSLGLSTGAFYYFFHPRIIEKPERVVEKSVPTPCPEQKAPEVTPLPGAKPIKKADHMEANPTGPPIARAPLQPLSGGIQQSNSGGVNVLQGTTGENSPIINSPVTVGNVPKYIPPQDALTLTDYLLKAKGSAQNIKISIRADQFTRASPFVDEFYSLFKDAQWPMNGAGVSDVITFGSGTPQRFKGAVISMKGDPVKPDEQVQVNPGEPLFYIGNVLKALKVPIILSREQTLDAGVITVQFEGGFPDGDK
jgi:hypothetical protein